MDGQATNLEEEFVAALRKLGSQTIDKKAYLIELLTPYRTGAKLISALDNRLFNSLSLQDLPVSNDPTNPAPDFYFNATNLHTGNVMVFTREYLGDWEIGQLPHPTIKIAEAVAASAAFPPFFTPLRINTHSKSSDWEDPEPLVEPSGNSDLLDEGCGLADSLERSTLLPAFRSELALADGGVYDNLGLETAWKQYDTILVSDAGQRIGPDEVSRNKWVKNSLRVVALVDNQVRALRKRQIVASFTEKQRAGAYWSIRGNSTNMAIDSLNPPGLVKDFSSEQIARIAAVPTRLKGLSESKINQLINWGYAKCDVCVRAFYLNEVQPEAAVIPPKLPFPAPPSL